MQVIQSGVLDEERWAIDVVLPPEARTSIEALRQGRLLIIAALVLATAEGFFAATSYQSAGAFVGPTAVLSVGSPLALATLPLLWVIGLRRASMLLCLQHLVFVSACAFAGAGAVDASTWWLTPAPLVATVLLGSRAGVLSAVAASLTVGGMYVASATGLMKFSPPGGDFHEFVTLAAITVFAAVAGLAYANERARERSEARVEDAVERLQLANEKLSQVATALTMARDQAVADGARKTAFLEDMRHFSRTQTEALSL